MPSFLVFTFLMVLLFQPTGNINSALKPMDKIAHTFYKPIQ